MTRHIRIQISIMASLTIFVPALIGLGQPALADTVDGDPARGAKFYGDNCGRCHNARGPTEHLDRDWSISMTHMRVLAALPGQQARDIEAFLRATNNPPQPKIETVAATPPMAATLMETNGCFGCHAFQGRGGTLGPSLDGVLERRSADWIREKLANPRASKPDSIMPNADLSPAEIAAILAALGAPGSNGE